MLPTSESVLAALTQARLLCASHTLGIGKIARVEVA
jgi:hypothetical protein